MNVFKYHNVMTAKAALDATIARQKKRQMIVNKLRSSKRRLRKGRLHKTKTAIIKKSDIT